MRAFRKISFQLLLRLAMAFLLLRSLELLLAWNMHSLPENLSDILLIVLFNDAVMLMGVCAILILIGLPFAKSIKALKVVQSCLGALIILVGSMLSHYFVITQTLLGADFFSYESADIVLTIKASGSFNPLVLLLYILPQVAFWLPIKKSFSHIGSNKFTQWVVFILVFMAMGTGLFLNKITGTANYWAKNKLSYFTTNGINYFYNKHQPSQIRLAVDRKTSYYHFAKNNNVIAPLLKELPKTPPKVIFLVVEGLGVDFLAGGKYEGYMPFLDSLSKQSVYWPNTLSTTGRTFGVLPSILGGLPYPNDGFLALSPDFPPSYSLINIAKANEMPTHYYYGGNANFDGQDVFLESQGVEQIFDENSLINGYSRMKSNDAGFSWGYPDGELFRFYVNQQKVQPFDKPKIDILLTLSMHEPFLVEDKKILTAFDKRYQATILTENKRKIAESYQPIFQSVFYTDSKIKELFQSLQSEPGFENTLVFITGDHRVIPLPFDNLIERFKVPLIMYSQNLKKPRVFPSVQTHSDVYPTLVGFYANHYQFKVPTQIFSMSAGLDTSMRFVSNKTQPLMINKGDASQLIYHNWWFTNGVAYEIGKNLTLKSEANPAMSDSLLTILQQLTSEMNLLCEHQLLLPDTMSNINYNRLTVFKIDKFDMEWFVEQQFDTLKADDLFYQARALAFSKHYPEARICLMALLNKSPNYSDARILLGRTYAWDGKYELAEEQLQLAIHRNPMYEDAYLALTDNYRWWGKQEQAIQIITSGAERLPQSEAIKQKLKQLKP